MDLFGFFYRCSSGLGNLLDRAELFVVSSDIKDQLILALADLVTLVVCVATHFHRSLLASERVSIDIYSTFPGPIDSFRGRCEHISDLMWRHQLMREGLEGDKGRVAPPKPCDSCLWYKSSRRNQYPERLVAARRPSGCPYHRSHGPLGPGARGGHLHVGEAIPDAILERRKAGPFYHL